MHLSVSNVIEIVGAAFAAGGAWFGMKHAIRAAHSKVETLAAEMRAGFALLHSRLDTLGASAKVEAEHIESNVIDLARRV